MTGPTSGVAADTGVWTHLCLTFRTFTLHNPMIQVYRNGERVIATSSVTLSQMTYTAPANPDRLYLGNQAPAGTTSPLLSMDGAADELRVYARELKAPEIRLAHALNVYSSSLLSRYFSFNSGVGAVFYDFTDPCARALQYPDEWRPPFTTNSAARELGHEYMLSTTIVVYAISNYKYMMGSATDKHSHTFYIRPLAADGSASGAPTSFTTTGEPQVTGRYRYQLPTPMTLTPGKWMLSWGCNAGDAYGQSDPTSGGWGTFPNTLPAMTNTHQVQFDGGSYSTTPGVIPPTANLLSGRSYGLDWEYCISVCGSQDNSRPARPLLQPEWESSVNPLCLPGPQLSSIQLQPVTLGQPNYALTPAFSPTVFDYTVTVPTGTTSVALAASWSTSGKSMSVWASGPLGGAGGNQGPQVAMAPGVPIVYTLNLVGSASPGNRFVVRSFTDGMLYSIALSFPCPPATTDDGHLRLLGNRAMTLASDRTLWSSLLANKDFSVCLWLSNTEFWQGAARVVLSFGDAYGLNQNLALMYTPNGAAGVYLSGGGLASVTDLNSIKISKFNWVHWCFVLGSSTITANGGQLSLWLNGASAGNVVTGSNSVDWSPLAGSEGVTVGQYGVVGATRAANDDMGAYPGRIDELRIYSRMLTSPELSAAPSNIYPLTNLLVFYPFSDASDGTGVCYDHSGNGRHWADCVLESSGGSVATNTMVVPAARLESGSSAPNCISSALFSNMCRDIVSGC